MYLYYQRDLGDSVLTTLNKVFHKDRMQWKKIGKNMCKNRPTKVKMNYSVKVKSKIHSEIYHRISINLRCYEKMPEEKILLKKIRKNR